MQLVPHRRSEDCHRFKRKDDCSKLFWRLICVIYNELKSCFDVLPIQMRLMEDRVNFLAIWLPGGKVCSYNISFTDTSCSIEQIYLAH